MRKIKIYLIIKGLFLLVFLLSFFFVFNDEAFYDIELRTNQVELDEMHEMKDNVLFYLRSGGDISEEYFNEKEIIHLADVRNLIIIAKALYIGLLFLFFLTLIFILMDDALRLLTLQKIFVGTGLGILVFSIISFLLKSKFHFFFIIFHKVLFRNDYWMLNPATDNLIILFPQQFFIDFVVKVYTNALIIALFLLIIGLILHFIHKK